MFYRGDTAQKTEFSSKDFVSKCADLVTFIEEICNGKLQKSVMEKMFLCSVSALILIFSRDQCRSFAYLHTFEIPKNQGLTLQNEVTQ